MKTIAFSDGRGGAQFRTWSDDAERALQEAVKAGVPKHILRDEADQRENQERGDRDGLS